MLEFLKNLNFPPNGIETLGIGGTFLTLLFFVIKYFLADRRAREAETAVESWRIKAQDEYKQRVEAKNEVLEYKRDQQKRIDKKRDDLAYRDIDLELSKIDSWTVDKD